MQKRIYKVLTPIPRRDGSGSWFMRVGSGYTNKDDSINLYLDAIPAHQDRGLKLQIRELDEADLRQRDGSHVASTGPGNAPLGPPLDASAASASDQPY